MLLLPPSEFLDIEIRRHSFSDSELHSENTLVQVYVNRKKVHLSNVGILYKVDMLTVSWKQ